MSEHLQKRPMANEEAFKEKASMYQEALDKAGHKHKLVYEKVDINSLNRKKKQRKKICPTI